MFILFIISIISIISIMFIMVGGVMGTSPPCPLPVPAPHHPAPPRLGVARPLRRRIGADPAALHRTSSYYDDDYY